MMRSERRRRWLKRRMEWRLHVRGRRVGSLDPAPAGAVTEIQYAVVTGRGVRFEALRAPVEFTDWLDGLRRQVARGLP